MGGREREDLGDGARRIAATCRPRSGDTKVHEYKRLGADAGEERGDRRGDAGAMSGRWARRREGDGGAQRATWVRRLEGEVVGAGGEVVLGGQQGAVVVERVVHVAVQGDDLARGHDARCPA